VSKRALACAAVALVALALALLFGNAPSAGAHATLVGTVPAADGVVDTVPDVVELRFDEPVETTDDAVQVFGPDGQRVDRGTVEAVDGGATLRAPVEGDEQGTYTVAWRVTSEDSHTLTGSFVFHNSTRTGAVDVSGGGSDTATDVAGGIGRWLGYAGTLAAVGAAALALLLPRGRPWGRGTPAASPGGGTAPPAGGGDAPGDWATGRPAGTGIGAPGPAEPAGAGGSVAVAEGGGAGDGDGNGNGSDGVHGGRGRDATTGTPATTTAMARLRTLALAGALVGAVGALVALVAMLAESAGRDLVDAVGLVADLAPDTRTGRLGLLRVALGLAAASAAAIVPVWRRSPVPVLVLGGGALAATALAGHAWTAPDRWLAAGSDLVHLGAVAVWAGGLLALLVALPFLPTAPDRLRLASRFSGVAVAAVAVVALSGTVSGWQQLGGLGDLTSTGYGRLLLAKVAGFAVLVTLGWLNRSRLVALVERTAAPLQRSLRVEVLVAAVVLALTAALVHQPPARTESRAEPFDTTATADGGQVVTATVEPATAGPNDIHLYFYAGSGNEPLAVDAVQVTAATADVPARRLQVTPITTNHVTVAGASLPSAGTWIIEVTAVQAGQPLVFTIEVPIA
jgi:putative copper export protein/methionine-rich copper-binding protein CopC